MEKMDIINKRLKEDFDLLESRGYEVVGVFLQGSQNYNLDYEDSDIDTKAIVLPSFRDFLFGKKQISTTIELEVTREHIDTKDIRIMFDNFKKQNINFVEILFTEYKYMNPKYKELFQPMFDIRERIARYDRLRAIKAMYGMACEKKKALRHPYPTTMHKIEKFGYDPKQLHHIIRLADFQDEYMYGYKYADILKYNDTNVTYMIDVKKGRVYDEEGAVETANKIVTLMKESVEEFKNRYNNVIDVELDDIFEKVMTDIFSLRFREELGIKVEF